MARSSSDQSMPFLQSGFIGFIASALRADGAGLLLCCDAMRCADLAHTLAGKHIPPLHRQSTGLDALNLVFVIYFVLFLYIYIKVIIRL
jgi:hypothetical protein